MLSRSRVRRIRKNFFVLQMFSSFSSPYGGDSEDGEAISSSSAVVDDGDVPSGI